MKRMGKIGIGIALGIAFLAPVTSCSEEKLSEEELCQYMREENETNEEFKYSYDTEQKTVIVFPILTNGETNCVLPSEFHGYPIEVAYIQYTDTLKSIHFSKNIKKVIFKVYEIPIYRDGESEILEYKKENNI